ncbi:hypothetical protein pEaSNUABM30_00317 [Erwinia phage pEa_SNUABM_30]|uniref:Uncharacterized protein n=1 Tax=Erwinia phage pEa_SNUABM_30 TaxID=2869553 RepID=A0AAE8XQ74_9CAUD|nr:hypothetical protein MPK69_gp317 [Erwinia phage pEa_SNUABM_30]UAW53435.1 hypothetical protein pEaSNUABM30_00317 [Erwinia phage pEa_SNUABM_30]
MTQEVDHGANIVRMIGERDEKIHTLTNELAEAVGDKKDVEHVLEDEVHSNTVLRVALQRKVRQHATEIALRDERIREVTGFCNEQTEEVRALKAELESVKSKQEAANPLPFALHMIMCAGINHYYTIVMQLAHGTVNRETNRVARDLAEQNKLDTVGKQPSLYRSVAMYCSAAGTDVPPGATLRESLKAHIEANIDLFLKDPQFEIARSMLRLVWAANKKAAHMGFGAGNICRSFNWMPAAEVGSLETLDDEDDYEELFCESLQTICFDLINHSF